MHAREVGRPALLRGTATAAFLFLSTAATAQSVAIPDPSQPAADAVGDIVVTAQKRAESVQRVPITITALDSAAIVRNNITSIVDLPRIVPTLKYGVGPGSFNSRFNLRGLGSPGSSALESSIALFLNGIYVPRPAGQINTLLDVTGIEVLSGPQGTLFGRNASAGAITLRTGVPGRLLAGSVNAEVGTGAHYKLSGAVDVPLSDTVSIRIAGLADQFGGYWQNDLLHRRFGGLDTYAGRVTLRASLAPQLEWIVRADYLEANGDGLGNQKLIPSTLTPTTLANYVAVNDGIVPNLDLYSRHNNDNTSLTTTHNYNWGASSDLSYTTDSGFVVRLLDGYRQSRVKEVLGDITSTSVLILGRDNLFDSKSHSHELQLISPKRGLLGRRFDFVAGLYYFDEKLLIDIANNFLGPKFCSSIAPPPLRVSCAAGPQQRATDAYFNQRTKSVAAYGQGTYALADKLNLTLGLRWTRDDKNALYVGRAINPAAAFLVANETTPLDYGQSKLTYRANLTWTPLDRVLLFATYSTGFKSGGFNSNGANINLGAVGEKRRFGPETIDNYEVGFKSEFLDRKVTLNATAYRMDVAGFQERAQDGSGTAVVRNVGNVRNQGVDVQLVVSPSPMVKFTTSASYLDSKFTSYAKAPCFTGQSVAQGCVGGFQNLAGAPLTYAPKWSGNVGAEFNGNVGAGELRWRANGDVSFTTKQNLNGQIDNSPQAIQKGYALLNARLSLLGPHDRWSVALFANNLTNKGYCTSIAYQPLEAPYGLRFVGGTALRCFVGPPRTLGIATGLKF